MVLVTTYSPHLYVLVYVYIFIYAERVICRYAEEYIYVCAELTVMYRKALTFGFEAIIPVCI